MVNILFVTLNVTSKATQSAILSQYLKHSAKLCICIVWYVMKPSTIVSVSRSTLRHPRPAELLCLFVIRELACSQVVIALNMI